MTTAARAVLTALLIGAAAAVMPSPRPRHRPPAWAVELAQLDAELRRITGRGGLSCSCGRCSA